MGKTLAIYGAKSLALSTYVAINELYPEQQIFGFIVKVLKGNPKTLAGFPVFELRDVEEKDLCIIIATPEHLHYNIINDLTNLGFKDYICLDSKKQSILMEQYFTRIGKFPSLHTLEIGQKKAELCVCMAQFHKDNVLQNIYELPEWIIPIQVGAALTDINLGLLRDDEGENISLKNVNYSELTALYWMWKNKFYKNADKILQYYGLCHYRRMLDLSEDDILRLTNNKIDVVLPFPLLHAPNILEHHTRYVKEEDWNAMCKALTELQPEYARVLPDIFKYPYFYNYNIFLAKKRVFNEYCSWLFPILSRTEQLSCPNGWERADRYIGYLAENLQTLYFMYHEKDLKMAHVGCNMLL